MIDSYMHFNWNQRVKVQNNIDGVCDTYKQFLKTPPSRYILPLYLPATKAFV